MFSSFLIYSTCASYPQTLVKVVFTIISMIACHCDKSIIYIAYPKWSACSSTFRPMHDARKVDIYLKLITLVYI